MIFWWLIVEEFLYIQVSCAWVKPARLMSSYGNGYCVFFLWLDKVSSWLIEPISKMSFVSISVSLSRFNASKYNPIPAG